jgi:protein CWC15
LERKHQIEGETEEKEEPENVVQLDLDADESVSEDSGSGSESEEEEEEDTEELLRELAKIKAEREQERLEKERLEQEKEREKMQEEALQGNPLMQGEFGVKRRWDADVIFRNQTKGEVERKKRFINDLTRSDFHRKFMSKYIK